MTAQEQKPPRPAPQRLVVHPARIWFFLAAFFAGAGLFALFARDRSGQTLWPLFLVLFPIGAAIFLYAQSAVIADQRGLRWRRGLGRWQSAAWEEVEDYFRQSTKTDSFDVIVVRGGRKLKLGSEWNDLKRLEAWVSEHAKNARASGWLVRSSEGTITGTHTFSYSEKSIRSQKVAVMIFASLFGALTIFVLVICWLERRPDQIVAARALGIALPTILLFGIWQIQRDARRTIQDIRERIAHQERIEADEQGITFWRNGEPKRAFWGEVERLSTKSLQSNGSLVSQITLQTTQGELTFTTALSDYALLSALIAFYAPQARFVSSTVRPRLNEALVSTEWDDGRRIFHYRTRSNRSGLALFWLVPLFCLIGVGGVVLIWLRYGLELGDMPRDGLAGVVGFGVGAIALWALFLWRYKTARLVLDKESLTHYGLWGRRRVFFEEMAVVGRDDLGYYIECTDGSRLIRWGSHLAGCTELLEELERRAGMGLVP